MIPAWDVRRIWYDAVSWQKRPIIRGGGHGLRADLAGFICLAVLIDVWSRHVAGWSVRLAGRYASLAFGKRRQDMGVRPSAGTGGDASDNAMAESFFASLECELLDRRRFKTKTKTKTKTEARLAVFTRVEGWYKPRRRLCTSGLPCSISAGVEQCQDRRRSSRWANRRRCGTSRLGKWRS